MSDRIQLSQLDRGAKFRLSHHVYVFDETLKHNVQCVQTTAMTVVDIRVVENKPQYVCRADSQAFTNHTVVVKDPEDVMIIKL